MVTTTIRWEDKELNDVKQAAKRVGLPVALFVKSLALAKIRYAENMFDPVLKRELLLAKQESEDVDTFMSAEDFLTDLKAHSKNDN